MDENRYREKLELVKRKRTKIYDQYVECLLQAGERLSANHLTTSRKYKNLADIEKQKLELIDYILNILDT